jgi:lysophospholipase L1-like esterase
MIIRVLSFLTICVLFIPRAADSRQLQQVIRIAPYGNSITQAAGDHDSYRYPLWKKLIDAGISFDFVGSMTTNFNNVTRSYADYKGKQFDRDHEGHWGWRADQILNEPNNNINNWLTGYTPDMVLLHIGTNDCSQGNDINSTINEIKQIIAKLRNDNPEVVIFLANLIPCSIANNINDINSRIEALPEELTTETSPIIFVDQNSGINMNADLQGDRIHPNASGEEKMAQKWFDAIDDYLNNLVVAEDTILKIAPYGNSITQADGNHDSYRYPLWKKLIDAEIPFNFVGSMNTNFNNVNRSVADYKGKQFDKDHEGHWGWRADQILNEANNNISNWLTQYTPDMVLMHIGTNDCIQGQDNNTTLNEIKQIVAKLRDDNPEVVIFLSNLIPCGAANSITDMNNKIKTLPEELATETSPVIFVDQFTGFDMSKDIQGDNIHPNASGEEKMAQKWFDAINGYLTNTRTRNQAAITIAPHQTASSYRINVLGLQRCQERSASLSATGVFTNLLGKQLLTGTASKKTGNGVYIIPAPADKR